MRKFAFRLQRALQFALLRENQSKKKVAATLQRMAFLEKYSTKLEERLKAAIEWSNRAVNTLEGDAHRQAILPTMDESKRIGVLLEEEKEALKAAQDELIRQSRRRRSLESLREKRQSDFRKDEARREQKKIDDMVSLGQARKLALPTQGD